MADMADMADSQDKNFFVRLIDNIMSAMERFVVNYPKMKTRVATIWLNSWYTSLHDSWVHCWVYIALQNLFIGMINLYYCLADGYSDRIVRTNNYVAKYWVGRYFLLDGSGAFKARNGAKFSTEIGAGITTFCAMAYIISVRTYLEIIYHIGN